MGLHDCMGSQDCIRLYGIHNTIWDPPCDHKTLWGHKAIWDHKRKGCFHNLSLLHIVRELIYVHCDVNTF